MVLLPQGLQALKQVAKQVGFDLRGAYLNLDGGFDSARNRKYIFNAGMIPNIKENPRNELVASFGNCFKLLKSWEQTATRAVRAAAAQGPENVAITRISGPHSGSASHAFC